MSVDLPPIPTVRERQPAGSTSGSPEKTKSSGRTPPPAATPRPTAAQKKDEVLKQDLAQLYTLAGVMTSLVRADIGNSMVEHGEEAADKWIELAQKNTRVRKALEDLTAASVWGAIIAVHVKMFAPAIAFLPTPEPSTAAADASWSAGMEFDPNAMDLAMQMMNGLRGTGEPAVDTVTV